MLVTAYIGMGSNLGDRAGNLLAAVRGLQNLGLGPITLSRVYETEAVETFPQPDFLNMVAQFRSPDLPPPQQLLNQLMSLEADLGRTREVPRGPRSIDLDLLLYGDEVCDTASLQLPHPRLHRRRFVLEPLAELAPTLVHPTLKKTIAELLLALDDDASVRLWTP